jgi:exosortase A
MQTPSLTLYFLYSTILIVPVVFWSTTAGLISHWRNDAAYNYGFFIFPISFWLLYRMRNIISQTPLKPEPIALVFILAMLIIWLLSRLVSINVTEQFSMVALIPLIIWFSLGSKIFKVALFPLWFLVLAVPMGKSLIPPLMEITADFTVNLVSNLGIPVYREGLNFILPTGHWSVVEACSGLNYLISSVTLGCLYAYLTYSANSKRIIFVVMICFIAVIANGLRASGIVLIGHFSNMRYGTGGDHTFYGWIFYGLVIFLVFYVGSLWADKETAPSKQDHPGLNESELPVKSVHFALITLTLLLSAKAAFYLAYVGNEPQPTTLERTLTISLTNWKIVQHDSAINWQPVVNNPTFLSNGVYQLDSYEVKLSVATFLSMSEKTDILSSQNKIVTSSGSGWKILADRREEQNSFFVKEYLIANNDRQLLLWNWNLLGQEETIDRKLGKLIMLKNLLLHGRSDGSIFFLTTAIEGDIESAREKLNFFLVDNYPNLRQHFSTLYSKDTSEK